MAYLDRLLTFSDNQTLDNSAAQVSTDVVDLGSANVDLGTGENLYLVIDIGTITGGTDPTITATLQESDDTTAANFANISTVTTGSQTASGEHKLRLPVGTVDKRYLRISYALGGTARATSTIVDAYIVRDIDEYTAYPSGYTVTT